MSEAAHGSILFVDDEDRVLSGLRRSLSPMRTEWDMHFACGAEAALALLSERPIDVLVTDIRMPGMGGTELLEWVRAGYPDVVRIALTAYQERKTMIRTICAAHHLLLKPCEPSALRLIMQEWFGVLAAMPTLTVRRAILGAGPLPVRAATYVALLNGAAAGRLDERAVGELVRHDIFLMADLFHFGSALFQESGATLHSATDAIGAVGAQTISELVLSRGIPPWGGDDARLLEVDALQRHSEAVARRAGELAEAVGGGVVRFRHACETAGYLHGIGRVIALPGDGAAVSEAVRGGCLLRCWGFPAAVVEAVRRQDEAPAAGDGRTVQHVLYQAHRECGEGV